MDAPLVPVKLSHPRIDGLPVLAAWLTDSNPDDVTVPSCAAAPERTPMPTNAGTEMHTNHRRGARRLRRSAGDDDRDPIDRCSRHRGAQGHGERTRCDGETLDGK